MKKKIYTVLISLFLLADALLLGYFIVLIHRHQYNHQNLLSAKIDVAKSADYHLPFVKPFGSDEFFLFVFTPDKTVHSEILSSDKVKITVNGVQYDSAYDSTLICTESYPLRQGTLDLRVESRYPARMAPVECNFVLVYFFGAFSFMLQLTGVLLFLCILLTFCVFLLRP